MTDVDVSLAVTLSRSNRPGQGIWNEVPPRDDSPQENRRPTSNFIKSESEPCFDPGYTLVEKLQTISTKFRKQQEGGDFPVNFMRHYYDVYGLLQQAQIQAFIGTDPYLAHKAKRFRAADNPVIADNAAFLLPDPSTRSRYDAAYRETSALYYGVKPTFDEILAELGRWATRL